MSKAKHDCLDLNWPILLSKDTNCRGRAFQPLTHFINVWNSRRDSNDANITIETHDSADNCFESCPPLLIIEHMYLVNQQEFNLFEIVQVLP